MPIDWTLSTAPWADDEQVVRAAVPTVYLTQRSAAIWGSQASRSEWICSGRPQPVKHPGYLGPNWAAARQHPLVQAFERKYRKPEPVSLGKDAAADAFISALSSRNRELEQRVRELEEGWKAAVDVVRDAVLYERYGMAEGGFTGDQINAVLGIIDDYGYAPAGPSANASSEQIAGAK